MKNIFETIGHTLSGAVDYVVEKNRRAAQINRLKMVIRKEERAAEKAYIALGKYYYHTLRDELNAVTEPHCAAVDNATRRMDRAMSRLESMCFREEGNSCPEGGCASCGYDCDMREDSWEEEDAEFHEEPETACPCAAEEASCEENPCEEAPCEEPAAPAEAPVEEPEEVQEAPKAEPQVEPVVPEVPIPGSAPEAADPQDNREIPFL